MISVLGSPVLGSPVLGSPVLGSPVLGSPVLGSPVLGSLQPPMLPAPVRRRASNVEDMAPDQATLTSFQNPKRPPTACIFGCGRSYDQAARSWRWPSMVAS